MALSAKQMALFGQVRVNMMQIDSKLVQYVSLLELYNDGWWVTERFGTIVALVKPRSNLKDGFAHTMRRIVTDVNLDALDTEIKTIADRKYEKYKARLEDKRKYRLAKWRINEYDNVSMLRGED